MPENQVAPAGNRGQGDGERAEGSRLAYPTASAPTAATCPHAHTRATADGALAVCVSCGRVVRSLTPEGALEVLRLAARYGVDPLAHEGGADYGVREPTRRRLNVVPRTPAPRPTARSAAAPRQSPSPREKRGYRPDAF